LITKGWSSRTENGSEAYLLKTSKNRGPFPSDDVLLKLFSLVINSISMKWTMPIRDCKAVLYYSIR
jgi:transposase-like protein